MNKIVGLVSAFVLGLGLTVTPSAYAMENSSKTSNTVNSSNTAENGVTKVTILVDNTTLVGKMYKGESGLSMLIETDGKKILFDAGYSDAFIHNAERMGIDLTTIDALVISHGHFDHTVGLTALIDYFNVRGLKKKIDLITLNDTMLSKESKGQSYGNIVRDEVLDLYFNHIKSDEPYKITENLMLLGKIERKFDFEKFTPNGKVFKDGKWIEDNMEDDSAILLKNGNSISVITGCSHAGVCNIIETAKKVSGIDKVDYLIGGIHMLKPTPEKMKGTLDYLTKLNLTALYPTHCIDLKSKVEMGKVLKISEAGVGTVIEIKAE